MSSAEADPGTSDRWRSRFRWFWAGESVSLLGTQITVLALPLIAVLTLHASDTEVGVLGMARYAPTWLLGLVVGAWVDSRPRRPLMIGSALGSALLLAAVPLARAMDVLTIGLLIGIALGLGALSVVYKTAYPAFVPTLVPDAHLATANSRLVASASVAEVGGPGLGGLMVAAFGAPLTLLADACSSVVSALTLTRIGGEERVEPLSTPWLRRIRDGLSATFGDRYLRPICLQAGCYNAWEGALVIAFLLYGVRTLGLSPAQVGLVFSVGAIGALLGSLVAPWAARRWGFGPATVTSMVVGCVAPCAIPLAPANAGVVVVAASFALFVAGVGIAASSVYVITLRQRLVDPTLMGRATAGYQFVSYGGIPLGNLLGGLLVTHLGARSALGVVAIGLALTPTLILLSPVRSLRELPARSS